MSEAVQDNIEEQRFELKIEGQTAYVYYELAPGLVTLMHTDVPLVMSGKGGRLAAAQGHAGTGAVTRLEGEGGIAPSRRVTSPSIRSSAI